jgi:hypothetical protein
MPISRQIKINRKTFTISKLPIHLYIVYYEKFDAFKIGISCRETVYTRLNNLTTRYFWPDYKIIFKIEIPSIYEEELKQVEKELQEIFKSKKGQVIVKNPNMYCSFENKETKIFTAKSKLANGGSEIFNLNKKDLIYAVNYLKKIEKKFNYDIS